MSAPIVSSAPVRPKPEPKRKTKNSDPRAGSSSGLSSGATVAAHHAPLEFNIPSENLMTQGPPAPYHKSYNTQLVQGGGAPREVPVRQAAGQKWRDESLLEWPENDFRLFVGNLDKETRLDQLEKAFKHYPSFAKAKLVMSNVPEPNTTTFK